MCVCVCVRARARACVRACVQATAQREKAGGMDSVIANYVEDFCTPPLRVRGSAALEFDTHAS